MIRQGLKLLFCVLLVIGGFWGWKLIATSEPKIFGANAVPVVTSTSRIVWGFAVTLLGVVLGAGYRELQNIRANGITRFNPLVFLAMLFTLTELWAGLFGAPIVFGALLQTTDGISDTGFAVVALQNGFCCTMIIGGIIGRVTGQTDGRSNGSSRGSGAGRTDGHGAAGKGPAATHAPKAKATKASVPPGDATATKPSTTTTNPPNASGQT